MLLILSPPLIEAGRMNSQPEICSVSFQLAI